MYLALINALDFYLLVKVIESAIKTTLTDLFAINERFYYITLTTSGEARAPALSAWSYEALSRYPKEEQKFICWSYADSPYSLYKYDEYWRDVEQLFLQRPKMDCFDDEQWEREGAFRINAMVQAMRNVDRQGLFSKNQPRDELFINVEYMPPDFTNTRRAFLLNDPNSAIFQQWLTEAAEDEG